ncbi:c-type cytochrome [Chryseobacterium geocarposphaerae]|uniref:Cytochrome c n=1 Tax=Chryseobacterium geocarposphaerae TaxID=1416776 RepID=A0A2M9C5W4_9FLAO|nr:c-type cytochrome [Chryseobacterium geocarposphaerae]PJJ66209.1 cytochrome c [Chryseobacterium geocarposphaerae]
MKKLVLAGCLGMLMFSCTKKEQASVSETSAEPVATTNAHLSGNQIIETLDCSGCHSVSERMIGPSYQEIADKYSEKDMDALATKIIEGGSGVWGNVPMQPHSQVSREDAKKMVSYILSLKKK